MATESRREVFERKIVVFIEGQSFGKVVGSDTEVVNEVAGPHSSVSFVLMAPALMAQEHGILIKLFFEGNEPQAQTVRDGTYPFRLPVLLLARDEPQLLVDTFSTFVWSDEGQRIVEMHEYSPIVPQKTKEIHRRD